MKNGTKYCGIAPEKSKAGSVSACLCAVATVLILGTAGCTEKEPAALLPRNFPLFLEDITLKESTPFAVFTPTASTSGEDSVVWVPVDETGDPAIIGKVPPTKIEPADSVADRSSKTDPVPPSGIPIPDKITGKAEPKILSPVPGETTIPEGYTLQVGAYVIKDNVIKEKERATALGLKPYVMEMKRSIKMYCVLVREGAGKETTAEAVNDLISRGFEARMLSGSAGYEAAAGVFYYEKDAVSLSQEVAKLGFSPRIVERDVEVTIWGLRVGSYRTIEEAQGDKTLLSRNGFNPVILKGGR